MIKIRQISMVFILVCTAGIALMAGLQYYQRQMELRQQEILEEQQISEEIMARNAEAQSRVQEMQKEIEELLPEKEKLAQFIDRINSGQMAAETEQVSGNALSGQLTVSGNAAEETVSGNDISISDNSLLPEQLFQNLISGNSISDNSVSGNGISENSLSGNTLSGNTLPDGRINYYDGTMTDSSIFDPWRTIYVQPEMSLEERRQYRTSLQETLEVNQSDREFIAENQKDFSGLKIACLGDSITAAANLDNLEGYEQYAYPARLAELLDAGEVCNLGIGGSSIGRYWADAFVDRYQEIPQDADIILVMGGTNDGFCVSDQEFGSLTERTPRTFCGDLDELMRGLKENYPDAEVFFATPLPNILHDYLRSERDYLLPQKDFADVIRTLAQEYGFHVVDLYNSNILDSHDADVVAEYMPDGVHCNQEGYQILAEHFAAELVRHAQVMEE